MDPLPIHTVWSYRTEWTIHDIVNLSYPDIAADVKVGRPLVDGAKVTAKVVAHGKGEKVYIFKYKAKSNYRRRQGHRQPYTEVLIEKIEA